MRLGRWPFWGFLIGFTSTLISRHFPRKKEGGEGEYIPSLPHFYVFITNKDYSQVKDMFCFFFGNIGCYMTTMCNCYHTP